MVVVLGDVSEGSGEEMDGVIGDYSLIVKMRVFRNSGLTCFMKQE